MGEMHQRYRWRAALGAHSWPAPSHSYIFCLKAAFHSDVANNKTLSRCLIPTANNKDLNLWLQPLEVIHFVLVEMYHNLCKD